MATNDYHIYRYDSGLRLVVLSVPSKVAYIGIVVNAGSRDEDDDKHGLAHFVEHTIFKGTDRRRSYQISSCMESIGGELNAYTSKDETAVYTNAPAGNAQRAIELLADLVINSRFPDQELDKEREVVVEEINSYLDSPEERVFDEFEELIFAGSDLAHNILGSPESVRTLRSGDCRSFIDKFYAPGNLTIYAMVPDDPDKIARYVERSFGSLQRSMPEFHRTLPAPPAPFAITRDHGNHQANTIVGVPLFGRNDPRRPALFLLNNYFGGPCMNSRLNRELREEHGYVYTVESAISLYSDTGLLSIYFGCDAATVDKCLKIINRELDRLAQSRLSDTIFNRVRRQYCGQLLVSTDQRESRAMAMGKSLLYYDRIFDADTMLAQVMQTSADDLRDVAQLLAPDKCSRLTLL